MKKGNFSTDMACTREERLMVYLIILDICVVTPVTSIAVGVLCHTLI